MIVSKKISTKKQPQESEEMIFGNLREYSQPYYRNYDKEVVDYYETKKNLYNYGVIINYIKKKETYEIYLFVESTSATISGLLSKCVEKKYRAKIYYYYLIHLAKKGNLKKIYKKVIYFAHKIHK